MANSESDTLEQKYLLPNGLIFGASAIFSVIYYAAGLYKDPDPDPVFIWSLLVLAMLCSLVGVFIYLYKKILKR